MLIKTVARIDKFRLTYPDMYGRSETIFTWKKTPKKKNLNYENWNIGKTLGGKNPGKTKKPPTAHPNVRPYLQHIRVVKGRNEQQMLKQQEGEWGWRWDKKLHIKL